jgi:hypothetical protein
MWVKRTNIQVSERKESSLKKRSAIINYFIDAKPLRSSIILALSFLLLIFFLTKIYGLGSGYKFISVKHEPISWREAVSYLPREMLVCLFMGCFVYYLLNKIPKVEFQKPYVCDICQKIKEYDGKISCECGGIFRDIDEMEWIDNKNKTATQQLLQRNHE